MDLNGDGEKNSFFQRIVLLMSFFLILLFVAYEFLEASSQGFLMMKIIDFKEKGYTASLTLFLSNYSSEKREGLLLVLLGYEDSRVSENATHYRFTDFKMLNFSSVLTLDPGGEKRLDLNLPLASGAKRIVFIYCYDSSVSVQTDYGLVVLRRDRAVWVQTWIS